MHIYSVQHNNSDHQSSQIHAFIIKKEAKFRPELSMFAAI